MHEQKTHREEHLGLLTARAVVTILLMLGLLLGLRLNGLTAIEQDAPIQMVENVVAAASNRVVTR